MAHEHMTAHFQQLRQKRKSPVQWQRLLLGATLSASSMFGRPEGCIDQLTEVERAAIVTLHKMGWTGTRHRAGDQVQ